MINNYLAENVNELIRELDYMIMKIVNDKDNKEEENQNIDQLENNEVNETETSLPLAMKNLLNLRKR